MVPARWLYNSSLTHLAPQHIRPTTLSQASESFNYGLFDDQNGAHTPWSDEGAAQLTGSRYAILFDARATYKNEPVEVRFICHFTQGAPAKNADVVARQRYQEAYRQHVSQAYSR